jgi:hypothetical protein
MLTLIEVAREALKLRPLPKVARGLAILRSVAQETPELPQAEAEF